MNASPKFLTPQSAALDTLEGMVNSYVRGRKKGATLARVVGHVKRARRSGVSEEEIRFRIRKAATDPPYVRPERVHEIAQLFLS
jgi:hypothetical protein